MIEELDRANAIITEYLTLAKNKAIKLKKHNLNSIIKAVHPLIQSDAVLTDKYIQLELGDIPDLLLDINEMRQLILNLARNGLEAMLPGGNLLIRTQLQGNQIILMVQDEGAGIAPELLEKIGTPFFTTKDTGTGLGLAVCYSIATRHHATIEVESSSSGTAFYVKFSILPKQP